MKRIVAWLLTLGILAVAAPMRADKDDDKKDAKQGEKKDDKKDDKKKDEKKEEQKKKDDKKDDKKTEEKLTGDQKRDLEKLSGTFTVTHFEFDGKPLGSEDLKKLKVVQKGAEWDFYEGEKITRGKDKVYTDKKPKHIDSVYTNGEMNGKSVLGIYEISNDTIKYCWADFDKERPKEFASKPESRVTLMILQRVKEEKPVEKDKDKDKEKAKDKDKEKAKDKDKEKAKDKDKEKAKDKDKQ
jgi:uncharacterized protein (TIGR03067 family)